MSTALTEGRQEHKANAVGRDGLFRANLGNVQPLKGKPIRDELANGSPSEVQAREEDESKEMGTDSLLQSVHIFRWKGITYKGALDAVEEQNLHSHEDGRGRVQVEDVEGLEPALAKEVADCGTSVS